MALRGSSRWYWDEGVVTLKVQIVSLVWEES